MGAETAKHVVFIGAGSNMGSRKENLQRSLSLLADIPTTSIEKVSKVYLSEPLGMKEESWFYNAVFQLHTGLSPHSLLMSCKTIEELLGRAKDHPQWSPRTLDLDLLLYDKLVRKDENLSLPHPELPNRKFVLLPLLELANPVHPILKKTTAELLASCPDSSEISPIDEFELLVPGGKGGKE